MDSATHINQLVHSASNVIAHYWPMTTFVHHNPIRSLETYPFHEAVKIAQQFIGGNGYLSNTMYRNLLTSGRISDGQIDEALTTTLNHNLNESVEIHGQTITRHQVVKAHLLNGITPPFYEAIPALVESHPQADFIEALSNRLPETEIELDDCNAIASSMTLAQWCDETLTTEVNWTVNREVIKWCEAFLDEGHATWPMPFREHGFYTAWRHIACQEWSPCGIANSKALIEALPSSAEAALEEHLQALAIPEAQQQEYLSQHLADLYGWASFIHWRSENPDDQWQQAYPIHLTEYLAVRLFYERALVQQTCQQRLHIKGTYPCIVQYMQQQQAAIPSTVHLHQQGDAWRLTTLASALRLPCKFLESATEKDLVQIISWLDAFPEADHGPVWLTAYEAGYQASLVTDLLSTLSTEQPDATQRPLAQLMFCIDVRSEPFRRHIESSGHYETIGFAGFFGIPISCQALDHQHETDQCPAILKPSYVIHEVPRHPNCKATESHNQGLNFLSAFNNTLSSLKNHVLSPFIMVESIGWFFGWHLLERTFFPGKYRMWNEPIGQSVMPKVATTLTRDADELGRGLTEEQQCTAIETALRTMGLTHNFGRLVVVTGHTSQTDNNPFEAALNCGACGGNSGEPNARLFADIANKPSVRQTLAANGIVIPEDTHFIGAVHNTTTDDVMLYDTENIPGTHRADIEQLKSDLEQAKVKNNLERCLRLPGAETKTSADKAVREIFRRSGDWSETRPEWGLSGNAAFIIGRRSLTKKLNLHGRTFLNSHDYRLDPTGTLLEGILMGPMIVGQWINAEHYFSATDPEVYGSGSKIYHNVVGRFGIMSGAQSDLRTGLPVQSMANGDITYHEPLRLLVVVEAPRERILAIVERQPALKQLCDNQWIHLMALDTDSNEKLFRYMPQQGWVSEKQAVGQRPLQVPANTAART